MTTAVQDSNEAELVLAAATGRSSVIEAVEWLAHGYALTSDADPHVVLKALAHAPASDLRTQAARRLTPGVISSAFDAAASLLQPELIPAPEKYEQALAELVNSCPERRLTNINADAVLAAQRRNPLVIETLCQAATVTYAELKARVPGLPSDSGRAWSPSQIERAFAELNAVIRGAVTASVPGAVPTRPLELLAANKTGQAAWASLEAAVADGVSYGTLLAQRAAGGTWRTHRDRTNSKIVPTIAGALCVELDRRGIDYLRSTALGGPHAASAVQRLTKSDGQIGVVAVEDAQPMFGVIFRLATDGGSVRKAIGSLRSMKRSTAFTTAVVAIGAGWSRRNETADLALDFGGQIYSPDDLPALAVEIKRALNLHGDEEPA